MAAIIRALLAVLKKVDPRRLQAAVTQVRKAGVDVPDGSANGVAQRIGTLVKDNPIKAQVALSALVYALPEASFYNVFDLFDDLFEADSPEATAIGAIRAEMRDVAEKREGDGDPDTTFGIQNDEFARTQQAINEYRQVYATARYFFPRANQLNAVIELSRLEPSALKALEKDYEDRRR